MATITSTSTRVTIDGAYKDFAGTVSGSTITRTSGDSVASSDAGRFVIWENGSDTGDWEVRFISSSSSTTLTIIDPFNGTPSGTEDFRISTTLDDIVSAGVGVTNVGNQYNFNNRDYHLRSGAFLGAVDASIESVGSLSTSWECWNETAICFGILRGGENNGSTVTERGCFIRMKSTNIMQNVYSSTNSKASNGPYIGLYGCHVDSTHTASGANAWAFMRMRGPNRFIGTAMDGTVGGRFYHESSEWVDCRMAGNNLLTPAWSLGASFTRDIENVTFLSGHTACKSYNNFGGTFRNVTVNLDRFTGSFWYAGGHTTSVVNFIDCTTFADSDINDPGTSNFQQAGTLKQAKTIKYTTAESDGTALQDVKVNVYNVDGTQMGAEVSAVDGVVPEIVTYFRIWTNNSPSVYKAPFTIRLRKYGHSYQNFTSAVSEPIKQEYRLRDNTVIALSETDANALSGISIDYTNKHLILTASHTLSEIYDYCQGSLMSNMDEEEFLRSSDGVTFTLDSAWELRMQSGGDLTGTSGKTLSGTLRIQDTGVEVGPLTVIGSVLYNSVPSATYDGFNVSGTLTFGAGGTYNYTNGSLGTLVNASGSAVTVGTSNVTIGTNSGPNITVVAAPRTLTLTGLKVNTEVRIYTAGTGTAVAGVENSGTSEAFSISDNSVDVIIHSLGYLNQKIEGIGTTSDVTLPISQVVDRQYNNP